MIEELEANMGSGYRGNRKLKSKGVQLEWSQERLQEYLKCAKDPVYFAEKYIQIVHVDRGLDSYHSI
jgi:hypothetical protein